ncbi:MAG: hypothetical protein EXS41_09830 [Opitutaceae bacterium]|nr:hypothetical protein [Opitutaceae bacterium]
MRSTPACLPLRAAFTFALSLSLSVSFLLPVLSAADTPGAVGTITGRVLNPATGDYVRNAEVRLEGTNQITATEGDGTFRFANVAPGSATITVAFTGYEMVRDSFTVAAGQAAVREISLVSTAAAPRKVGDVIQLDAFNVSTEREGNAKAIMAQRRSMDIITSVSSDIFGDVTDGNVGEFLKYLPGFDLEYVESEARGPRLGGMDPQYVGMSVDGIRSASPDPGLGAGRSRAPSFEGVAINSLESIEVNRTTSSDSDADSPAGTINMKTKRAFERKGRQMSANFNLNFNTEEFTLRRTYGPGDQPHYKWSPNVVFDYSESFFNQRLGVLVSASRGSSYSEQYQFTMDYNRNPTAADPRPLVLRNLDFKDGPKVIDKDSLLITADFRATRRLTLSVNANYAYTQGDFWNRNFTFTAANSNSNVNNGRSTVGGDGVLSISTRSSATNTVPAIANGGSSSTKHVYNRTIAPRFEYKLDSWVIDGAATYSMGTKRYDSLARGYSNSESGSILSNFTATRPSTDSMNWVIRQTSGPDWFNLANFTNTSTTSGGTRANDTGRRFKTAIWNGQLNAKWTLPLQRFPTVVKFGGKLNEEYRTQFNPEAALTWSYIGPGGNTLTGYNALTGVPIIVPTGSWANLGPAFVTPHTFDTGTTSAIAAIHNIGGTAGVPPRPSRNAIGQLFNTRPELFAFTGATPDNYYTAHVANSRNVKQTVTAAYSQMDVRFSSAFTVRGGLRVEETSNRFREFDPRLRTEIVRAGFPTNAAGRATTIPGLQYQFFSQPRVDRESKYRNWFPSVVGKYSLGRSLQFQAGFNKAISRPAIDDLTGVFNIQEDVLLVSTPNADLLPEYSKNYQARVSYYFEPSGQFSLGVSQNEITNLRESFDFTADQFGNEDPDLANFTFRSVRNNSQLRRFRNLEVGYNQTLAFLPEKFRGTTIGFTYARSYANLRMNNLAPHRATARLGYSYRRFSSNLGLVWRDNTPDSNPGRFYRHLTQLDGQINWKLTRQLTLYAQARNITQEPVRWFESAPGAKEGQSAVLWKYQSYGSLWVFGVKGLF